MNWIASHLALISTFVSSATLFVWIFYAHLLHKSFARGERPLVLIHQAGGMGPGSSCLVVNLSRQPLHVVNVHFILRTENHRFLLRLNEFQRITSSDERNWARENVMKEGPLDSGDFLSLGDFSSMLEGARSDDDGRDERQDQELAEKTEAFEIRVTAMFSAFDRPIGAIRRFAVSAEGEEISLIPKSPLTEQLTSFRQRRRVHQWLSDSLTDVSAE